MNETTEHHQFYKSKIEYKIGRYIPNSIRLFEGFPKEDMSWIKESNYGSVLYFFGANCQACDIEVAFKTYSNHKEFNYVIFCENYNDELLKEYQTRHESVKVYAYNSRCISSEIGVNVVPFMLVVNKIGQIITAGVVNSYDHSQELLSPLVRTVQRSI
ncbi:hypothetical protein [Paenibacillus sp. Leaf72]|uniref:hypothetical protein n=1 Tax=Paenibacillus sp. Leaf72 TaxID=1736234 RepID=UPI0006F50123|nr:hypothetical protein [Paenibacillus sp. Leaf72]KQO10860.1 hypothetical protein ASF12_10780 [Paenibacillus sp. Leaf72]